MAPGRSQAMSMSQATRNTITLRGSTAIVTEFFGFAVNSILYQRGIYPPETFDRRKKYGLTMLVTSDEGLTAYLGSVLQQISDWLMQGMLQKLVIVITGVQTREVLERWTFNIEADSAGAPSRSGEGENGRDAPRQTSDKSNKEIMGEIQAIIRQITASVTFLPLLEEPCTFDLLVYAKAESAVPSHWEESDPKYITNCEEVRLRSFTTKIHRVAAAVSYKTED